MAGLANARANGKILGRPPFRNRRAKCSDDPPAQFQLDGPFASGSWGRTLLPGQEPLRWQIREVRPGAAFTIEVLLDGAVIAFEWLFDAMSNHQTRITQRIVLSGDNARTYVNQVQAGFGSNLPDGMKGIADAMARAEQFNGTARMSVAFCRESLTGTTGCQGGQ